MQDFWDFLVDNKDTLTWLGGGAVVIAGGVWTVFKYFFPAEPKKKTQASTTTLSGMGMILSGNDNVIAAPVHFGLDETKAGRAVTEAVQPLSKQIAALVATVSREKGVPIATLQVILQKVGKAEVSEQDVPRVIKLIEEMADELLKFRAQVFSQQIALTRADHSDNTNRDSLLYYWMSYANDKYDQKLREKMAEWTLQSQLEEGGDVENRSTYDRYLAATAQNGKSREVLAPEVQILVKQWKTITDLTSKLSTEMNDMAIRAVRDLR